MVELICDGSSSYYIWRWFDRTPWYHSSSCFTGLWIISFTNCLFYTFWPVKIKGCVNKDSWERSIPTITVSVCVCALFATQSQHESCGRDQNVVVRMAQSQQMSKITCGKLVNKGKNKQTVFHQHLKNLLKRNEVDLCKLRRSLLARGQVVGCVSCFTVSSCLYSGDLLRSFLLLITGNNQQVLLCSKWSSASVSMIYKTFSHNINNSRI